MTNRPRVAPAGLAALLSLALSGSALAQAGFGIPGGSVGLTARGVPANPFASNYPTAPPPAVAPSPRHRVHAADAPRRRPARRAPRPR